jgi:hypothetical protein
MIIYKYQLYIHVSFKDEDSQVLVVFDALYCSDDGLVIFVLILRFVPCVLSFTREMCGCTSWRMLNMT